MIGGSRCDGPIVVGLVNNMPDAALRSTERQFRDVLSAAARGRNVVLRIFSFSGLPRSETAREYVNENHEDIEALWRAELDGLIVTGTEPRAPDLTDEPHWPVLMRLVDWAAEHTKATVWSCLAAHAAVRYLDGVERCRLPGKLSGVFECAKAADHPLIGYGAERWRTPHSRYNELREDDLAARGYQVLARSSGAGADTFVKRMPSLFLFLQGHPEYDPGALFREYRRDIGRFLAGEREEYPNLPCGYFGPYAAEALLSFRERVLRARDPSLLADFPAAGALAIADSWRPAAVSLYANWLSLLAEMKALAPAAVPVRWPAHAGIEASTALG